MPVERILDHHPQSHEASIPDGYSPIEEAENILKRENERRLIQDIEAMFDADEEKYLLRGTGFETAKQAAMLVKMKAEYPELTSVELNHAFADRTGWDFKGYYWEFLARNPFLINFVDFSEEQIRSSKTGQRLLSVINTDERAGAAKIAIEHLEDNFKKHKTREPRHKALYAIHSSHGWARDGYEDYPDDQIYLYQFDENSKLSAGTMRLSMSLDEHEGFISKLIGDEDFNKGLSYKERLFNTSTTIVELDDEDFEGYLDRLEKHLQRNIAWVDTDKKGKLIKEHTFSDMRNVIQNREQLLNLDKEIEDIAEDLDQYLKQDIDFTDPQNLKDLVIKLGSSAMNMQYALKVKKGYKGKKDYQKLSSEAKDLGGCVVSESSSGTMAEVPTLEWLTRKEYKSEGKCNKCHKYAKPSKLGSWVGPCSICYDCVRQYWGKAA